MSYHAFMSYSHAADLALAPAFRLALHRFARPLFKRRALSVFLDQSSLSANPALWPAIEKALSSAEHFVLLACPESAASVWVRKEIDWWLTHRSVDRMLVLLTGGEIVWDPTVRDFAWQHTTAIASELKGHFPDEPLYVDLRWARTDPALNLGNPRFRSAVLDVAAPLHGRPKDELDGEDIRQNRRTRRLAWLVASVTTLLAAAAAFQTVVANRERQEAVKQRIEAERQRKEAECQRAEADRNREEADHQRGIAVKERDRATEQESIARAQRDEATRQRDLALARALTSDAIRQWTNPQRWDEAMLLAVESMKRSPTAGNYELLVKLSREGARVVATIDGSLPVFSPDGKWIALGNRKAELDVLPARGGARRAQFPDHEPTCFTPSSNRVLSRTGRLFDVTAGSEVPLPVQLERDSRFVVSANCRFLTTAGPNGVVIDLESATRTGRFSGEITPDLLSVNNTGDRVATSADGGVTLHDSQSGRPLWTWKAPQKVVYLAFTLDGNRLVAQANGTHFLDASSGRLLAESPARGTPSSDFEQTAEIEKDAVRLWDVPGKVWVESLRLPRGLTSLAWSPDGEFLAMGVQGDGTFRFLQSGSLLQLAGFPSRGVGRTYIAVNLSPRLDLAAVTFDSQWTRIVELPRDRPIFTLPPDARPGSVALSSDGRRAAFRTRGQRIRIAETATGTQVSEVDCRPVAFLQFALNADGSRLLTTCNADFNLHDTESGKVLFHSDGAFRARVGFNQDGSVADAGGLLLRAVDGQELQKSAIVAAADGRGRLSAARRGDRIYVTALGRTGNSRHWNPEVAEPENLALNAGGSLLAVAGREKRVKIFDVQTGKVRSVLEHIDPNQLIFRFTHLLFSDSGKLIATVADDPTVAQNAEAVLRVFNTSTGLELARIPMRGTIHALRFTADDSAVETAVGRRRIRWQRHPLTPEEVIGNACALIQRNLTDDEWRRFLGAAARRDTCPSARR